MRWKVKNIKEKITKVPTENLYIALIGNIDSQIVSDNMYINKGEHAIFYTIVKKEDKYKDVYNNTDYNFRDENESYTILRMIKYPTNDFFVSLDVLRDQLTEYNNTLEPEINKNNTNQCFVRTRAKIYDRKSV